MDIDIPYGPDFRKRIDQALGDCKVLVVIIGPRWRGPKPDGSFRIFEEQDFVRTEVEAALAKGIEIVPVLVDGAQMPAPDDVPDSIKELTYRNAASVGAGRHFGLQVDDLLRAIDKIVGSKLSRFRLALAVALVALVATAIGLLGWYYFLPPHPFQGTWLLKTEWEAACKYPGREFAIYISKIGRVSSVALAQKPAVRLKSGTALADGRIKLEYWIAMPGQGEWLNVLEGSMTTRSGTVRSEKEGWKSGCPGTFTIEHHGNGGGNGGGG